jgi:hypothetical protein
MPVANTNKQVEKDSGLLSRRAEVFRSKMIHEFHLLETLGGNKDFDSASLPHLFTKDVIQEDPVITESSSLVQFQVYSNKVS